MISVAKDVTELIEFKTTGWSDGGYPNSLLGVIAVIRQTLLDADWYQRSSTFLTNTLKIMNHCTKPFSSELADLKVKDSFSIHDKRGSMQH